jgi:hypothetical protein
MNTITTGIAFTLGLLLLGGVGFLVRDIFKKLSGSGFVLLIGLMGLFVGERVFGDTDFRVGVLATAVLVLLASIGLRVFAMAGSHDARRKGHQTALIATIVSASSLVLYALTLPTATDALGLSAEALPRWTGSLSALFPIVLFGGLVPVLLIDQLMSAHPRMMPAGAMRHATTSGVSLALALALLFPLNYLASEHDQEWDVAYFRTTKPGESTIAITRTVSEPMEALLFYPAGNEVAQQLQRYFDVLAASSNGNLTVRLVDQALDPKLSEEVKVRENGVIVLRQGENTQTIKMNAELDRAKRDLRKLDGTVNKTMLKLVKGSRDLYFLTGHGEASSREKDEPLRKLNLWKREVLEAQNFKVKTYGVAEGSSQSVPDDAGVVIVAAPTEPLLPEEIDTLVRWFEGGGALMVLLEPGADPMTDLLSRLGVEAGTAPLANTQYHLKQTGQKADRVLLATNKFGTHASVKTLSRNNREFGLIMPTSVRVQKREGSPHKISTLVRTLDDTFEDLDGDREPGVDEPKSSLELGLAIETQGGEKQGRAIVMGDTSLLADDVLRYSKGNVLFGYDAVRWLVGDEDLAGEVENEEDVKIQHTRQEDTAWFLMSIVGVPGLVLVFGFVVLRLRRREGVA